MPGRNPYEGPISRRRFLQTIGVAATGGALLACTRPPESPTPVPTVTAFSKPSGEAPTAENGPSVKVEMFTNTDPELSFSMPKDPYFAEPLHDTLNTAVDGKLIKVPLINFLSTTGTPDNPSAVLQVYKEPETRTLDQIQQAIQPTDQVKVLKTERIKVGGLDAIALTTEINVPGHKIRIAKRVIAVDKDKSAWAIDLLTSPEEQKKAEKIFDTMVAGFIPNKTEAAAKEKLSNSSIRLVAYNTEIIDREPQTVAGYDKGGTSFELSTPADITSIQIPIRAVRNPKPITIELSGNGVKKSVTIPADKIGQNDDWKTISFGEAVHTTPGKYLLALTDTDEKDRDAGGYYNIKNAIGFLSFSMGYKLYARVDGQKQWDAIEKQPLETYPGETYKIKVPQGWKYQKSDASSDYYGNNGKVDEFDGNTINGYTTFYTISQEKPVAGNVTPGEYVASVKKRLKDARPNVTTIQEEKVRIKNTDHPLLVITDDQGRVTTQALIKSQRGWYRITAQANPMVEPEERKRFIEKVLPTFDPA